MYDLKLDKAYFPAQTEHDIHQTTVGSVLREAAAKWPEQEALVEAGMDCQLGRTWTYAELLAASEKLAKALLSRFQPGERVVVWAPNIPEWVIMEYACAHAGLTLVTANPAFQPRELEYVVKQSGAVGLFYTEEYRGNPMGDIVRSVAAGLPQLREMTDMENEASMLAGFDAGQVLPEVKPEDAAQVQYTSGTTGFPKGAVLHHLGLTNNARHQTLRNNLPRHGTVINYMPMFHTTGCALATLGSCQEGRRLIIAKVFNPGPILDLIAREKPAIIIGVPTMLVALAEEQIANPRDMSHVLAAGAGGSMVPPELVRKVCSAFDCDFVIVYGQTETSPVITQTWRTDSVEDTSGTVGQALPHVEISIRNPSTGRVCDIDEVGEICARGYNIMTGYNNNPEATAAAIDQDGWLHTGDLGTMDERGYVKITGRVKEMIIRGGENMFPAEIENVLLEHPDVAETAVVGIPDDIWGEVVAAFVRMERNKPMDQNALKAHCRAHISPQKTPAHWVQVEDWPLTGSGKIQKFVLRDQFVAGKFSVG